MRARHQAALRIEDLGVEAGVHLDGDTLPVHHHVERRILRIRPRRDCEHLARTHPVIRRPRLDPQAQQGIRLVAHIGPGPRSVPWMSD